MDLWSNFNLFGACFGPLTSYQTQDNKHPHQNLQEVMKMSKQVFVMIILFCCKVWTITWKVEINPKLVTKRNKLTIIIRFYFLAMVGSNPMKSYKTYIYMKT